MPNKNFDERQRLAHDLLQDVVELLEIFQEVNRNPSIKAVPIHYDELDTYAPYARPHVETTLCTGVRFELLVAQTFHVLARMSTFLNTVNDENRETIETAQRGLIEILQEGLKRGSTRKG